MFGNMVLSKLSLGYDVCSTPTELLNTYRLILSRFGFKETKPPPRQRDTEANHCSARVSTLLYQPISCSRKSVHLQASEVIMPDPALCLFCSQEVRPRQEAIACDICEGWQHRKCGATGKNGFFFLQNYTDIKKIDPD